MPPTSPQPSNTARPSPPAGRTIVGDAMRYRGATYVYGGTGARVGDWDCSSYVSYVLGHDLGLALPGGSWRAVTAGGTVHGPVVMSYVQWGGAVTVGSPEPGALVCWQGYGTNAHIGISIGGGRMISAYDTASGTIVTPIAGNGPQGAGPPIFRRVLGVPGGSTVPAGSGGGALSLAQQLAALVSDPLRILTAPFALARAVLGLEGLAALGLVAGGVLAVVGLAVIVGTLGAWALTAAAGSLFGHGTSRAQEA